MGSLPKVAIAILNYNGRKFFDEFLPSVLAVRYPNYEIWVIDNASADDSVAHLRSHFPAVKIVENPWNGGYAEGYNMGLGKIDAELVLLLNSDVAVHPDFLEPLVASINQPGVFAVQPKILSYTHPTQFEYAGAGGGMIDNLGYPFCRGRILDSVESDEGQYNDEGEIFWASGAACLIRKSVFGQLGGFYGYFFMHNEEIDLCWRARNAGWTIKYNGLSVVKHLGGGSLQKESPRKTHFNFRNNLVMNTRNMPLLQLCWVLPLRFLLDLAACFKFIVSGSAENGMAVLKAWFQFLGWLIMPAAGKWPGNRGWANNKGRYKGSIVFRYFLQGKKKWPL